MLDTYHLDLHECLGAVVQQISRLSAVDAHDTQKQLPAQAQRHRATGDFGSHNDRDIFGDFVLQDLILRQLLLEICRQPDAGQRPRPRQQVLGKEHCGGWVYGRPSGRWVVGGCPRARCCFGRERVGRARASGGVASSFACALGRRGASVPRSVSRVR